MNVRIEALLQSHALVLIFSVRGSSLLGGWHGDRYGRGAVVGVSDLLALIALKALFIRELERLCWITPSGALVLRNDLDKVLEELERILD